MKIIRLFIQNTCRISGDCYDRYLIRMYEMRESVKIMNKFVIKLKMDPLQFLAKFTNPLEPI